ncbi:MAG TPA: hypothetical protein VML96_09705 [Egibacteraceae bacterium]|nr:hypothetical protein [Egibacteraceae bacterium]
MAAPEMALDERRARLGLLPEHLDVTAHAHDRRWRSEAGERLSADAGRQSGDDRARRPGGFIERAREVQHHCNAQIDHVLREEAGVDQPAATALTYRQIGCIVANLLNIGSAVVVPLDQLDYPTPDSGDEADDG